MKTSPNYRGTLEHNEKCRGAMFLPRSNSSLYQDIDAEDPLLPNSSSDLFQSGLKKRPSKISVAYTMGPEGNLLEPRPLPIEIRLAPHHPPTIHGETHSKIILQILIPYLIAGIGMVFAGIYFNMVQGWEVFIEVSEIIVLVPSLLGLKGNLEMTLASRLSTEANLGNMDSKKERFSMITGNLCLVQAQAIVIALLAAWVSVMFSGLVKNSFSCDHMLLMCASSLVTASFASLILGLITSFVIVISRMTNINPDNVATPIAGSLGDITSIFFLSLSAQYLYDLESVRIVCIGIIAVFCLMLPIMIWLARSNKYTSDVLSNGWTPIIMAMIISSVGGMILDHMVTSYKGIAIFQPLINGVGGNLVSIQASRMSTVLHQIAQLGVLPLGTEIFISPIKMFLSKEQFALTARSLMMLVVPGHVVFLFCIYIFKEMHTINVIFLVLYLFAAIFQVSILLYFSYILTNWFWKLKSDPDNNTIPYLTALGDVLGIALLGLTFYINEMLELYVY